MTTSEPVDRLLSRLRTHRERIGITAEQLDEQLLLGPGWVERFESGEVPPSIDMILAIAHQINADPAVLFAGIHEDEPASVVRHLYAEPDGDDLILHFRYAEHDAQYRLPDSTLDDFKDVVKTLQSGLARLVTLPTSDPDSRTVLSDSVARMFLHAVRIWPDTNPSDLWWFLVYRAYVDPYNHPALYARRDLGQSWRRTGGWALEEVLIRHYGPFLKQHGINLHMPRGTHKLELLSQLTIDARLEADKVDVLLSAERDGQEVCFGVVHVKTSFAERRTDDVPLSHALVRSGYTSILWTFDAKSMPSATPFNRGELGRLLAPAGDRRGAQRENVADHRSAKRKDIEDDGFFSACFSYNTNTLPTPPDQEAVARIYVCDFKDPDDEFSAFVIDEWQRFNR